MSNDKEEHGSLALWVAKRFMTKATDYFIMCVIGLAGLVLSGLWQPFSERVTAIWNSPLYLAEIQSTLDRITGANRITQQPEDMSYVEEPVYIGEDIVLVLFIGRTEVGAGCILHSIVPLFTDENNVSHPIDMRRPRQQLGPKVVKRVLRFTPPEELGPGRNSIRLQLEYTCGGETIYENTKPVYFLTLEKPE